VLGNPTPKGRPRFTRRGIAYTPKKTKEAETNFLAQAVEHKPTMPLHGALCVEMKIYKPKPKSKSKKVHYWTTRPDLDNYVKILDSLNGVFWLDDSQIVRMVAEKNYGEPARTEIKISQMEIKTG